MNLICICLLFLWTKNIRTIYHGRAKIGRHSVLHAQFDFCLLLFGPQKYHFCLYLALLLAFTYIWPIDVALITLIDDNSIYNHHVYSSIEAAPVCRILEQSNNYSWIYCISKNWGLKKVSSQMHLYL